MANYIIHKADSRGYADHVWLKSHHTFSFAGYFIPERVNFGELRDLDDEFVADGMGFGEHPHEQMEIVSIPLGGKVSQRDSTGSCGVIDKGDSLLMIASTGVPLREMNGIS